MANYSTLKAAVADVVKTNGTQAITGANLQSVLLSIINSVGGGGYIFAGVATPSTNAGTPDQNVFYIGGAGTYANFGTSVTVYDGSICVFKYNGSWTKEQIVMFDGIDTFPNPNYKLITSSGALSIANELSVPLGVKLTPITIGISQSDKIIDNNSNIVDIADGHISTPMQFKRGDCVIIRARSSLYTGAVSMTDSTGSTYSVVKTGSGAGYLVPYQSVTCIIPQDGYYAFSWVGDAVAYTSKMSIECLRTGIDIYQNQNETASLNTLSEVYVYDKYFSGVTRNVSVLSYLNRLYLIGYNYNAQQTWWAKTEVLNGAVNGKAYPVTFTNEGGSAAEAQDGDIIGYVAFEDVDTFRSTQVTTGLHFLNLDYISNIRLCPVIASTMSEYIQNGNKENRQGYNLLAMYDNITCCGDSLTYSQVSTSASTYRAAKKTYPQILASLCGNVVTTLATPGDTAKRWWDTYNSQLVAKSNNVYIVYLGTNGGLTDTIDTDCPVSGGIDDYADTNTGCYGKLLKTIQELGDKAILVKITTGFNYTTVTNEVIDKFGERFKFPVVKNDRIEDIVYRYYPDGSGYDNVHLNDLGYSYFTNRLIKDISDLSDVMLRRLCVE